MKLFELLKYKNLIKDFSNPKEFELFINNQKIIAYCGFDLTAKSLHVGNLITILTARQIWKQGHKLILILGDATTRIGDPSDKNEIRKMLSIEQIEENKKYIKECLAKFIPLNDKNVVVLENYNWFKDITYIDFLREIGAHFTINKMINIDFVKRRLDNEQPITFLEFNYMLMQAYDFYYLYKNYGCNLQVGGSDQWGNIIQGVEFIKRVNQNAEVFGMTFPLLADSNGNKIGKTTNGAVWLHQNMLNPYDYFQYFRNTPDNDVLNFLKIFTDLSNKEIEKYNNYKNEELNKVKEILAFEATKMCHGEFKATEALNKSREIFLNKNASVENIINVKINNNIVNLLLFLECTESKSEARRLIEQGAIKIDDKKITDIKFIFNENYLGRKIIFSIGKNKKFAIGFEE